MLFARRRILTAGLALLTLSAVARVQASIIIEPNNTPINPTVLASKQFVVSDDLNGSAGRADTLLCVSDPGYATIGQFNDNAPGVGNGFASQLVGVPLEQNGSAYFYVTGGGDTGFTGNHHGSGQYSIEYKIYNAAHALIETKPLEFENVAALTVDSIWLDPTLPNEPDRTGGTVDVTINNIVGPGDGDSLDFYRFSGMQPFQSFTATITTGIPTFHPLIGLYSNVNAPPITSIPMAVIPTLSGTADSQGRALIGVSAAIDILFHGEHIETGTYTLVVTPLVVPEPASWVLLGLGAALACLFRRRRCG